MINHIGVIYAKNETKLSWSIRQGAICDDNQIGQRRDQSYKCGPQKKIELSWLIGLGVVYDKNQSRQGHGNPTSVVCTKNEIEL